MIILKIRNLMGRLRPGKTAGPNGIHGTVLKKCTVSLTKPLS